jgi:hypothetical protein
MLRQRRQRPPANSPTALCQGAVASRPIARCEDESQDDAVNDSGVSGTNLWPNAGTAERLTSTYWRMSLFRELEDIWQERGSERLNLTEPYEDLGTAAAKHWTHAAGQPSPRFAPPSLAKLVTSDPASSSDLHVTVTHRWEGTVQEIFGDYFEALLIPVDEQGLEVVADISTQFVDQDDLAVLAPGAAFYLTVGRHSTRGRRQVTTQSLRFRRLGKWSEEDVDHFVKAGRKWRASLGFDDPK